MILSHIAAMARNRVIGQQNRLPWNIPEDMQFYKEKTRGHILIMGRKTFDSMPAVAHKHRMNIVITRSPSKFQDQDNVKYVGNLNEALRVAQELVPSFHDEVFIVGGGEIYMQSMPYVDRIYLTRIDAEFEGDTLYPELKPDEFELIDQKDRSTPVPFSFLTYARRVRKTAQV
jgi:dihydrofolate reductase